MALLQASGVLSEGASGLGRFVDMLKELPRVWMIPVWPVSVGFDNLDNKSHVIFG
jgi:hypothetical protein